MTKRESAQRTLFFLFVLALAVRLPTLRGTFVYDDRPVIEQNALIRDGSHAWQLFATPYWGVQLHAPKRERGTLYRPATMLSFALNYQLSGLRPAGYHAANALLHAAVAALVFLLGLRLGGPPAAAFVGALLFAVQPIHAEAVANLVGRAEILAALFTLAAWILCFQESRPLRLTAGFACFILALLSKENAIIFPAALAASELLGGRAATETLRRRWPVWAGLLVLCGLLLEWRHDIVGAALSAGGGGYFSGRSRLVIALTMARFFFRHELWPMLSGFGFCAEFSRPQIPDAQLTDPIAWLALLSLLTLIAGLCLYARRGSRAAMAGILFFIWLAPVSNLLLPIDVIGAERFLYLPSALACLAVGWIWAPFLGERGRTRPLAVLLLGSVAAFWAWRSVARDRVWESPDRFWQETVKEAPRSPRAWNGLATAALLDGNLAGGEAALRQALALDPGLLDARYNLAKAAFMEGRLEEARAGFKAILRDFPQDRDTLLNLGFIAEAEHRTPQAIGFFEKALAIDPYSATACRNLGILLGRSGDEQRGRQLLERYLALAPASENTADVRALLRNLAARDAARKITTGVGK